ncbi:hypothetical protein ACIRPO_25540 [Streptomyces bacillaris]|uniref:hypothetical protein n=1 Tax=Streptomyces bacillaris TaxID=68179 RepID=UPI00382E2A6F
MPDHRAGAGHSAAPFHRRPGAATAPGTRHPAPGTRQAYGIEFRAARFGSDGKRTEDARLTLRWR